MGAQGGEVQAGFAATEVDEEVAVDVLEADEVVVLVGKAEDVMVLV